MSEVQPSPHDIWFPLGRTLVWVAIKLGFAASFGFVPELLAVPFFVGLIAVQFSITTLFLGYKLGKAHFIVGGLGKLAFVIGLFLRTTIDVEFSMRLGIAIGLIATSLVNVIIGVRRHNQGLLNNE